MSYKLSWRKPTQQSGRDVKDFMSWNTKIPSGLLVDFFHKSTCFLSMHPSTGNRNDGRWTGGRGSSFAMPVGELWHTSCKHVNWFPRSFSSDLNTLDLIVEEVSIRWMKCSPWTNLNRASPRQLQNFRKRVWRSTDVRSTFHSYAAERTSMKRSFFQKMALSFGGAKGGEDQFKFGEIMLFFNLLQIKWIFTSHENTVCKTREQPAPEWRRNFQLMESRFAVFKRQSTIAREPETRRRRHGVAALLILLCEV